jgi:integrase
LVKPAAQLARCWYVAFLCLSYESVEDMRDARFALIQFMGEPLSYRQLVELLGLCALRGYDFVFATGTGRPMYYRNASARGLDEGAKRAGLNADPSLPKLSFHDLRHSAISHLIRSGADVVKVQRFAGHTKPSTTLDIYAHEFRAREGDDTGQRLATAFEGVL